MQQIQGGYTITLAAARTGAYRLTARYRRNGDAPGTYRWYGAERNATGSFKRDHALVVSPRKTRVLQLYEVNPLTILATGTTAKQRGTLADMAAGLGAGAAPRFSFEYLKKLGCNALWLQPFHPRAIAGREIDPGTSRPFELGSPYAVKNFFAVMPMMAKGFKPGGTAAADDTPAGRAQAMSEFQGFVRAADQQGIEIMVDAPFNHTGFDVELGEAGQRYWGGQASNANAEIRAVEARVFSRNGAYDQRAFNADSIGPAPDRFDFPKWKDTLDVYFGRYAALVENANQSQDFKQEDDWFDYSVGAEGDAGPGNGHFDRVTQSVWRFFADYLSFWLTKTGYPENATAETLNSSAGIDALRADFGQGLPPPAWEYIVNRTRARKWNFVFMAESLDGGEVSYRSARHFDLLNERIIFELHRAQRARDFQRVFQERRASYGTALVLLNTSSHDEDTYKDPYQALLRYAVNSTMEGVPMIFPGEELGIQGTVVPPSDSSATQGPSFGYDRYDAPIMGKPVPGFKTFNSLMPVWNKLARRDPQTLQLLNSYSAIGQARRGSAALKSGRSLFLQLKNGAANDDIFAVAKVSQRNTDPNVGDVVFAFVNLTPKQSAKTPEGNAYNLNRDDDHNGVNDFGIQAERQYNIKNIAAYAGTNPQRREAWVWDSPRSGRALLDEGMGVFLNAVPGNSDGWTAAPYEAQYLKLFDVTPRQLALTHPPTSP
jgi:glycosidase